MLLPRAASLFLKRRPRRSFPIRTARNQVTTNPKQRNKDGAILPALQGCELKNSSLVSRAGTKRTRKPVTAARYSLLPFWAPVFFPGRGSEAGRVGCSRGASSEVRKGSSVHISLELLFSTWWTSCIHLAPLEARTAPPYARVMKPRGERRATRSPRSPRPPTSNCSNIWLIRRAKRSFCRYSSRRLRWNNVNGWRPPVHRR